MLSRLSLGRPQFIPSAAGHWELDPRSWSRGGYCSPAEQKRKGSGGETQQSGAPKRRPPPSIHHSGGTEPAAFPGRKQRARGRWGQGARDPTPPLRLSSVPPPAPAPGHTRSFSTVSPLSLPESGGSGGRAAVLRLTPRRK